MQAGIANLLSPPGSSAGKQHVLRLVAALFLVSAGIVVAHFRSPHMAHTRAASTLLKARAPVPGSRLAPSSPSPSAVAAAYARQRKAGDRLLNAMRAAPDAWVGQYFHSDTRAVWVDPFRDFYRCPGILEKVGPLSDGGKWVCGVESLLQRPGCVIYSFGSNGDTSFEQVMLERTKCSVWTFDPTLDDADLAKVMAVPDLNFAAVGLAGKDGDMVIDGKVLPGRTLQTLMRERGHTWVDVLKMDIEGGEWAVLDGLIRKGSPPPISQAQIEFHVGDPRVAVETMAGLVGMGLRVFHVEENVYCGGGCGGLYYELSFANVDGEGQIVTGL